jgi:L-ascorbate metabolism protein UlaG (beta-lactamase superfamily)
VIGPQHRFFYSGDTATQAVQDIGARLGPFDMAFIKIGAYGPGQRGPTST